MRYDNTVGNLNIKLNTDRFSLQFVMAQKALDRLVLADSTPYVPFLSGHLRSMGHIPEDGVVEWNTPYAHYQYMGELYLAENGSSYAEKYEKKYPAGIDLEQHEKGTKSHWYEAAKNTHKSEWVRTVQRIGGGG